MHIFSPFSICNIRPTLFNPRLAHLLHYSVVLNYNYYLWEISLKQTSPPKAFA